MQLPFPFLQSLALVLLLSLGIACTPDPEPEPDWQVPDTYAFERNGSSTVNYEGQTQRLNMLGEMGSLMTGTRSLNATIEADQLRAMYANTAGAGFAGSYSKDLKSKTFSADTSFFLGWMDQMGADSKLAQEAAPGQAGFLSETYGSGSPANSGSAGYLVDANGIEHHQIIEKGLMGAVFFYQALEVYLSQDRMGELGNDAVLDEETYTAMEHYFDEAFGYVGLPISYPANGDQVRFWGNYANSRNNGSARFDRAGIAEELMLAFRTGRAAITAQDYVARDQAIATIAETWAIIVGATAADYLERSKAAQNPARYKKHHYLSEAIAFTLALTYHFEGGNSKFPPSYDSSKIQEALAILGPQTNLWEFTEADLQQAQDLIIAAFPNGTL